jgi:membrane peptidoglycan carboxypeptidase
VGTVLRQAAALLGKAAFTFAFKNIRSRVTGGVHKQDEKVLKAMVKDGKITQEAADKITQKQDEPWSFANVTEGIVAKLPTAFLRNFVENLLEEADESFEEAGYVTAGGLDAWIAQQQIASQPNPLGQERTVEILFNRAIDDNLAPA